MILDLWLLQLSIHLIKYPYRWRNCYCRKTIIRCLVYFVFCQGMLCLPFFYQLSINLLNDLFICRRYASCKSINWFKLDYNCVLWHIIIIRRIKIITLTIWIFENLWKKIMVNDFLSRVPSTNKRENKINWNS